MGTDLSDYVAFKTWSILSEIEQKRLIKLQRYCLWGLWGSMILTAAFPWAYAKALSIVCAFIFVYYHNGYSIQEWILKGYDKARKDADSNRQYDREVHFKLRGQRSHKNWDEILKNRPKWDGTKAFD